MNSDTKQKIKGMLPDYLADHYGISVNSKNFRCIIAPENHAHGDAHPSCSYNQKTMQVHCFTCGESMDIFDLIKRDYHLSTTAEAFQKAEELYSSKVGSAVSPIRTAAYKANGQKTKQAMTETAEPEAEAQESNADNRLFYEESAKSLWSPDGETALTYLHGRGISDETLRRFSVGFCSGWRGSEKMLPSDRIIIPRTDKTYLARAIEDIQAPKMIAGHQTDVFNFNAIREEKPCFVVEGELDAMSIEQAGGNAVAIGAVSGVRSFIKKLTAAIHAGEAAAPVYIIALDNDPAGEHAGVDMANEMKAARIPFITAHPFSGHKDANEALQADSEAFKQEVNAAVSAAEEEKQEMERREAERIEKERDEYMKTSAAGCVADFIAEIKRREHRPAIKTGFTSFDKALGGGLYDGLYCIGAVSSFGKTTFFMQIADQIACGGHDVMIFSLEMSRYELMAKSISRLTRIEASAQNKPTLACTTRDILDGSRYAGYSAEKKTIIDSAIETYKGIAGHLFIIEGQGETTPKYIADNVREHLMKTGNVPVVIVDYLQIIAPEDPRATDKQVIDKAVVELKRISRDFNTPVIVISSFNRASYSAGSDGMARQTDFKESGAIEYSADVLIGMQFTCAGAVDEKGKPIKVNEMEEKKRNPREETLVILKNRNGAVGGKTNVHFYAPFNYFVERRSE